MPARIVEIVDDLITIEVSGLLTYPELVEVQQQAARHVQQAGMIRFFIVARDFEGWTREGDWGNVSFQAENDAYIEKMALVGNREWEELVVLFTGQGVRRFPIQYFLHPEIQKARAWIDEPA